MKIQTTGGALHAAAAWAAKLAPTRPAAAVLGGVLLDAGEQLRLSASDFDTFGTVTTAATVIDDGRAVVSARLLAEITKVLKAGADVTLAAGPRGRLDMQSGRSRWSLPMLDVDEWPAYPDPGDPIGTVRADHLHHGLSRVLPAVAVEKDPAIPALNGVGLEMGEALTLAATDRYRFAVAHLPWQPTLDGEAAPIVIPGELLRTALAGIHGSQADVALCTDGSTVGVRSEHHQVAGRLIDGQHPKWRPFLEAPVENAATVACFEVAELLEAVIAVAMMIGEKEPLKLQFTQDGVELAPAVGQQGYADTSVEWRSWSGKPITVGVHHQWLRDALNCLDSPHAVITLTGNPVRPFLLRPADESGEPVPGYGHVVMPQRLTQRTKAAA